MGELRSHSRDVSKTQRIIDPSRTLALMRRALLALLVAVSGHRAYRLLTRGAVTVDIGSGRRTRPLGPLSWEIAAELGAPLGTVKSWNRRALNRLADQLQEQEPR